MRSGLKLDYTEEVNIDYNRLFEHVESLRKVLLIAVGRSGSDFFQSLLDGHPEILQFTGTWYFYHWWRQAKCKQNLPDLINEFIWHTCPSCNHIAKFKSHYNKIERWDQLGSNKNESFKVDVDNFKDHMLNILTGRELNSKNFFLAVNLAYGLATKLDIKKTKIIFYHIHRIERLIEFNEDFSDFDVICTIREPRNTLVSGMEHWRRYNIDTYAPAFFYCCLNRVFEGSEPILKYTSNLKTLKLEDLHLFSKKVLEEFCKIYGLEFKDCLLESSYQGKKWWGDLLSGRYLDGFNRNINETKWKDKLFFYDNFLIEFILEDRLRHYGYPVENKMSKFYLLFIIFLVFLPMKYELKILAYNLKKGSTIKAKISTVKNCVKFYILRILLYTKYIWKKFNKKRHLPDYFYSKNN